MIEIDQLTKDFGNFRAVDQISFSVNKGEVLGFLGPNGAGKSTTMKMITGYMTPTLGHAHIFGRDVHKNPIQVKSLMGYLPEGAPAWPDMTVAAFLKFIASVRQFRGKEAHHAIVQAVERTNIKTVLNQPIQTLSKGFKRRVGLAQAILHDPQVLIMDEPTDGLDPNQKKDVRDLILDMAQDKVIIISTHILEEVDEICNRAIIIDQGKIVADETPEALEARSVGHNSLMIRLATQDLVKAHKVLLGKPYLGQIKQIDEHQLHVFSPDRQSILANVQKCLAEAAIIPMEIFVEKGRLDDVFRSLTQSETLDYEEHIKNTFTQEKTEG